MPKNISFGSKSYNLPLTSEEEYWDDLVNFLGDIPSGVFQKGSGLFELTQEIDFGTLHGVKAKYWKSRSGNEANSGTIRLNKDDFVAFRNEANNADVILGKDVEDFLTFNNQRLLVDPTTTEGDLVTRNAAGILVRQDRSALKKEFDVEPLGKIVPVDARFASIPNTGEITDEGYALCNGQPISGLSGHELTTSEPNLPNLTDGRYLRGDSEVNSGNRAGTNTTILEEVNLPSHSHDSGSYETSLSGSFAPANHTHDRGSFHIEMSNHNGFLFYKSDTSGNPSYYVNGRVTPSGTTSLPPFSTPSTFGVKGSSGPTASASLSGSNSVTGTSSLVGSSQGFTNEPQHHSVVYLMKVKKV